MELDENNLIIQDDAPELSETLLGSDRVFDGGFLKVDSVEIELPNGVHKKHEVLRHPGAVGVVALDGEGRMLLVRQYRTALERLTWEIPAGKLDAGEDPYDAVVRELSEETGYNAGVVKYLASIAPAVGYSDEIIHLFLATDLEAGEAHPDEDEFVVAEWVEISTLVDSVLDRRIEDSKTVIAALLCDVIGHRA